MMSARLAASLARGVGGREQATIPPTVNVTTAFLAGAEEQ